MCVLERRGDENRKAPGKTVPFQTRINAAKLIDYLETEVAGSAVSLVFMWTRLTSPLPAAH